MIENGYIKFDCIWNDTAFDFPDYLFEKINHWREKLYHSKLIGCYPDGIGYGNISIRPDNYQFIITGTATGNKQILTKDDYALITSYELAKNRVFCRGKTRASAETLSHAAIYENNPGINAVIHIHHLKLWEKLKDKLPTTAYNIEYGTPQMAFEIARLFKQSTIYDLKIFVMGGHKEGIVSFGSDLDEAGEVILSYFSSPL